MLCTCSIHAVEVDALGGAQGLGKFKSRASLEVLTLSHLTATLPKMAQVARETSPKAPSPMRPSTFTSSCTE